jgi:hypothetical protein
VSDPNRHIATLRSGFWRRREWLPHGHSGLTLGTKGIADFFVFACNEASH